VINAYLAVLSVQKISPCFTSCRPLWGTF